jgi:hypothetical protein
MATNRRLSGTPGSPREESDIRYNYTNLNQIICASTQLGGTQPIHYSTDGGVNWSQTNLPPVAGDARQGDPTIDWTSDGTAWSITMGITPTSFVLRCFRSPDAGATWTFDSTLTSTQTNMDKQAFWVDHSPASPHRDNMYATWHNNAPCFVATRAGPGGTWQAPLQVSGAETTGTAIGGDIKTNANGDVFAFWPDTGSRGLYVAKSTNGGASFGTPVTIATTFGAYNLGLPAQGATIANRRVLIFVSGGAYRTASKDLVYACWTDLAGGAGCNTPGDEPGNTIASTCKSRIWFARSTNGGATWGAAQKINDQASSNDQFFARLAVDETNGVLAVVYYDTVNDPARVRTDLWLQTSYDDGQTWTAPDIVTTATTDETTAGSQANFQYGDYIGLTGYAGRFFACWTDRRNGGLEEIWGAPLFVKPGGPAIVVNLQDGLEFGTVCTGPKDLILEIFNVGSKDLSIFSVQRVAGSTGFTILSNPTTPLAISPGDHVDFTVRFVPTTPGTPENATIRISSNDPAQPFLDLSATGTGGVATAEVAIADAGDFGEVCLGSFVDRDLVINNSATCPLRITAITSSSPDFVVPGVISFPLVVSAGGSITVPLRFQPTALGSAAATISVFSNDPASPAQVQVQGTAPPPRLVLSIADRGDFCHTCVGDCNDKPLILSNSGKCKLTVTGISSSSGEFLVPDVTNFPLVIAAGTAVSLMLRFQPTSFGTKSATITVTSDDPASPATVAVSGTVPSGKLAITGTTYFGAVELGVRALQTVSICNVGECDLHVTKVAFKPLGPCEKYRHRGCDCGPDCGCGGCGPGCGCGHKRDGDDRHDHDKKHECDQKCLNFKIVTNPFPATVHPGSCLGVLIQYVPTCDNAACCELVIESDDPDDPSHTLFVTGHLRRTLQSALKCWAAQELQEILKAGKGC